MMWRLCFYWLGLLIVNLCEATIVTKVFFHKGHCADQLVFYLDAQPSVTSRASSGVREYLLQIKDISAQAQQALNQVEAGDGYKIHQQWHGQTLAIRIDFDPNKIIQVSAARFKPIGTPAGVVIKVERRGLAKGQICTRPSVKKTIVLDFGHGGHDAGTQVDGVMEKEIVRLIGLRLAKMLKLDGYVVHLTRPGDQYMALDERTRIANLSTDAGFFVSLHANYAANPLTEGLETFHMHHNLFSRIDADHKDHNKLRLNTQSERLADFVHQALIKIAAKFNLVDRKVKQSVSQVLLGVEMPAILIELGFLSNPKEAKLLNSAAYQDLLAKGIRNGINAYVHAAS